jgi:hypothetical protein
VWLSRRKNLFSNYSNARGKLFYVRSKLFRGFHFFSTTTTINPRFSLFPNAQHVFPTLLSSVFHSVTLVTITQLLFNPKRVKVRGKFDFDCWVYGVVIQILFCFDLLQFEVADIEVGESTAMRY